MEQRYRQRRRSASPPPNSVRSFSPLPRRIAVSSLVLVLLVSLLLVAGLDLRAVAIFLGACFVLAAAGLNFYSQLVQLERERLRHLREDQDQGPDHTAPAVNSDVASDHTNRHHPRPR